MATGLLDRGKLIAFDSRLGGEANIYIVDPRGGAARKIDVGLPGGNSFPTWSHDGNWIYFVNADDDLHAEVWKLPFKGGQAVRLTKVGALSPENLSTADMFTSAATGTFGKSRLMGRKNSRLKACLDSLPKARHGSYSDRAFTPGAT